MKVLFYSTKGYEKEYLIASNKGKAEVDFVSVPLSLNSVKLAQSYDAICIFVGDDGSAPVLKKLKMLGVTYLLVRAAGYDNVDIPTANSLGLRVANVPQYSPNAIAEHTLALILALNRKLILANEQVHLHDFTLNKLIGFDLYKKKVGVIGTGRIGSLVAKILHGFGCTVLAYDMHKNELLEEWHNTFYVGLQALCTMSDIITIHLPLTTDTRYLVNGKLIKSMKKGVMLINTSRGAILNTEDVLTYLLNGHIGYLGLDVYEKEKGVFFEDWTGKDISDPWLHQLLKCPNVLLTPHQAFATKDALLNIASTTFYNIECFTRGIAVENEILSVLPKDKTYQ